MSSLIELDKELRIIIANTSVPIEVRATNICEVLSMRYVDILEENLSFQAICDMATRIKTSKATEGENGVMWAEVVRLVHKMLDA